MLRSSTASLAQLPVISALVPTMRPVAPMVALSMKLVRSRSAAMRRRATIQHPYDVNAAAARNHAGKAAQDEYGTFIRRHDRASHCS